MNPFVLRALIRIPIIIPIKGREFIHRGTLNPKSIRWVWVSLEVLRAGLLEPTALESEFTVQRPRAQQI